MQPGAHPAGRQQRILVVEDDRVIADAVTRRLVSEGFAVDTVHDGPAAVSAAASVAYDATVLDVMLPGLDGHEVCRRIQSVRPVPVLMLTALAEETDRLIGLGVGADDYLAKPFSPRELVARVRALLRRVERAAQLAHADGDEDEPIRIGELMLDPASRRVVLAGTPVHLTRIEFDLLHVLARKPGHVVPRERLLEQVWAWQDGGIGAASSRSADSHVKALRRKLGAELIRTVHGVGYALDPPSAAPGAPGAPG